MSKLELILLGRFECLLSSDTRISLPTRKAEVLLAFLALTPGLRHPRERLINLLWSDRGETQARNSLRQCLSAIRKVLGDIAELALVVDRTTVCLNAALIEVDAIEFERLGLEGDYESLATAADLYQGEFLEGISIRDPACQEWLEHERARFGRQFIEILTNLAETQLVSHDFGHAIRSAERLVKQDPLGEAGWRLLMRAYADSGDRNHALQAFKRCRQTLRDELEIEPESATIELRDRIAGGKIASPAMPASPAEQSPDKPAADALPSTDHSVAVLPFDNLSGDPEQEYFSDGITDSIILNLSLFPRLNVKSRNSSFAFKQQIKSLGEISRELGVDYIVEGSIRKSADRIRITVQLIETASGNQVWGKRYDAEIDNLLDLEEALSRTIAATVTGQIESELQRIALAKGAADQQAYDLLLSGIYHFQRFNREDMAIAIDKFGQCLEKDPDNVRAHVMLYEAHAMNYLGRWTADHRASFRLGEQYIRRALQLDPDFAPAQGFFGEFLTFNGELDKAAAHIDKALYINPNDTDALTTKAVNLQAQCRFEAALEAAERALALDPYHPWAEWEIAGSQYCCGRYEQALETVAKFRTSPGFVTIYGIAANIKLGRIAAARQGLREFLRDCRENMLSMPQTTDEWYEYTRENYPYADPQTNRDLVDCLVRAGLEEETSPSERSPDADALPSIAVLPFQNMSGDPEQEYFSDGITAGIILSLGMFNGLSVKSQRSSFAFKNSVQSSSEIGAALGVEYLVEGSIRKSDAKVRISAQLVEAADGNQVWGRQYSAEAEDVLKLEQELGQTIAATISGRIGHTLQQSALRKPARDLKSYDLYLRGLYHFGKFTPQDLAIAIEQFERCIEIDPDNAEAHMQLGMTHEIIGYENWTEDREKSAELSEHHLRKAVELAPDNAWVHAYLSERLLYTHDLNQAEYHAEKAIELNPNLPEAYAAKAQVAMLDRRYDEALECARLCVQLDPYNSGAAWAAGEAYLLCGEYEKSVKTFRSIETPPNVVRAQIAAALAGMGQMALAKKEMRLYLENARRNMPDYPSSIDAWRQIWREYLPFKFDEDSENYVDLLLQAGLCDDMLEAADDIPSIAVLPFENMSGDPEQEYFADGITTDIIATLSRFKNIRTIARYSMLLYKGQKTPLAYVAAQQKVRYVLEGNVRKKGDRIRVSTELVDLQTDEVCWSDRYDRDLDDLFAVQDEITQSIALAMKAHLDDGGMAGVRSKGTGNLRAWELIMAAVDLQDTYIGKNILDARKMAEEAIELDPKYAYAWIALGWTHIQEAYTGHCESFEQAILAADSALERAREIDPDHTELLGLAGIIHVMRHETEAAVCCCREAVARDPGNPEMHGFLSYALLFCGDYAEARIHNRKMIELCPIPANWYYMLGAQIESMTGNLELAAQLFRKGIDTEPESPLCRFFLVDVLLRLGDEDEASRIVEEIRALDHEMRGSGLVHSYSSDPALRNALRANLKKFDLV